MFRLRLVLGVMLGARALCAAPLPADVEPVRILYRADAGCPTEEHFARGLFRRTERVRAALPGEPARTFTVTVSTAAGHGSGVLETTGLDGATTRREVAGNDCNEVVSALALVAALTINPEASTVERPALPAERGSTDPTPPAPFVPSAPIVAVSDAGQVHPARQEAARGSAFHFILGLEGQAFVGAVPAFAAGGGGFADLSPADAKIPSFRISMVVATTGSPPESRVGAEVVWFLGRLQVCPARIGFGERFLLNGCVALDAGTIQVKGIGLDHPNTDYKPWFAPGALARFAWLLRSGLELELGGGVALPLRRYPFTYVPAGATEPKELYKPSVAGGTFSLGVAYRFP